MPSVCSHPLRRDMLTTVKPPNKPGCTEPRESSRFQIGDHWRGVGDPDRYV
jgi:hypothetical protein